MAAGVGEPAPTAPAATHWVRRSITACRRFFPWYNEQHRHGGIALLTPDDVYYGRADALLAQRQRRMLAAYEAHPERFPNGPPVIRSLPNSVYINPPSDGDDQSPTEAQ